MDNNQLNQINNSPVPPPPPAGAPLTEPPVSTGPINPPPPPTNPTTSNPNQVFLTPSDNSKKIKIIGSVLGMVFLLFALGIAIYESQKVQIVEKKAIFPSCVIKENTRQANYPQTASGITITPFEQTEENGRWKLTWNLTGAQPGDHFKAEIKVHRCFVKTEVGGYDQCNAGDPNSQEVTKIVEFDAPPETKTDSIIPFTVEQEVGCCERDQADLVTLNETSWGTSFFIRSAWNEESCLQPTPTPTSTATPTITPTPTTSLTPTPSSPTTTPTLVTKTGCYLNCAQDSDCAGGLVCQNIDNSKKCVTSACPNETDCICNKSCYEVCGQDRECPSGTGCYSINGTYRCANPQCRDSVNCSCSTATPTSTITQEILPQVGNSLPTIGILGGGLLLITLSLLLAL